MTVAGKSMISLQLFRIAISVIGCYNYFISNNFQNISYIVIVIMVINFNARFKSIRVYYKKILYSLTKVAFS